MNLTLWSVSNRSLRVKARSNKRVMQGLKRQNLHTSSFLYTFSSAAANAALHV